MRLIIAQKNYSSWSMRPWLVLSHFKLPFETRTVWLGQPDTRSQIFQYSPSGRLPCLIDGDLTMWDSLAICEYLAEKFPQHALWPRDAAARAHARSISAEMHSGFAELRASMWMNIRASFAGKGATPAVMADITRIVSIWEDCLAHYEGPFLFGDFTIADAMYAPVVMRFNTYQPPLPAIAQAYAKRITELPAVQAWIADARVEPAAMAQYDVHP